MKKLRCCDTTQRSDSVTEQPCSLALSTRPCPSHPINEAIQSVLLHFNQEDISQNLVEKRSNPWLGESHSYANNCCSAPTELQFFEMLRPTRPLRKLFEWPLVPDNRLNQWFLAGEARLPRERQYISKGVRAIRRSTNMERLIKIVTIITFTVFIRI